MTPITLRAIIRASVYNYVGMAGYGATLAFLERIVRQLREEHKTEGDDGP